MKNYWSMFKDWALWLASPTLGVSLFMSPSLLLSFLQLLVKTAHGNDAAATPPQETVNHILRLQKALEEILEITTSTQVRHYISCFAQCPK